MSSAATDWRRRSRSAVLLPAVLPAGVPGRWGFAGAMHSECPLSLQRCRVCSASPGPAGTGLGSFSRLPLAAQRSLPSLCARGREGSSQHPHGSAQLSLLLQLPPKFCAGPGIPANSVLQLLKSQFTRGWTDSSRYPKSAAMEGAELAGRCSRGGRWSSEHLCGMREIIQWSWLFWCFCCRLRL